MHCPAKVPLSLFCSMKRSAVENDGDDASSARTPSASMVKFRKQDSPLLSNRLYFTKVNVARR